MIFRCIPTGMFGSNCYIIGDNGEGVIIDPGVVSEYILKTAAQVKLKIKYIILTHAHIDHICSMDEIRGKTGCLAMIHKDDAGLLMDSLYNGSMLTGMARSFKPADIFVEDGTAVDAGGLEIKIIHTPGHTPGGICISVDNCLFTGDTLFKMSIGRTDLGNGDYGQIMDSIKSRLMKLDDGVKVYPGHGDPTTIGFERENNPFIQYNQF